MHLPTLAALADRPDATPSGWSLRRVGPRGGRGDSPSTCDRGPRPTRATPSLISIANVQVSRLTSTGDAVKPAIAPDGNYLAYIRRQKGQDSLHVRQTATAATAEIVKAEPEVTPLGRNRVTG